MPGKAKTSTFLLSTAAVMMGPVEDLHALNVESHSIGLAKNVQFTTDPQRIELTQGRRSAPIISVRTSEGAKATFDVCEYTPRNLAYAAGLDGHSSSYESLTGLYNLQSPAVGGATSIVLSGNQTATIAVGDYLFIQKGATDYVYVFKVSSRVYSTHTVVSFSSGFSVPLNMTFPAGARVGRMSKVLVGSKSSQPYLSAKIVGLLPKDKTPFTILFPKVKIIRGLNVGLQLDQFGSMSFEIAPHFLLPSDSLYSEYKECSAILLSGQFELPFLSPEYAWVVHEGRNITYNGAYVYTAV